MKKIFSFVLIIAIACSVFGLGLTTAAADENVKFSLEVDPKQAAEGGTVEATIIVQNNYADPITGVTVVYTNNGSTVFSGQTIDAGKQYGTQKNYTVGFPAGSDTVALNFTLTYVDPDGATQTQTSATQVTESTVIKVTGSASADSSTVDAGDSVEFTFTFKNEGNVTIENASLVAPPIDGGSQIGTAFSLSAGGTKTMTYRTKVNETIKVEPTLTFTAGGTNKTLNLDSLTVTVEQKAAAGISLSLKADKDTVSAGEEVVLTASISNTGNTTLTGIKLLDNQGNAVQAEGSSLAAGASTTANVTITPQETGSYTYTVSAQDPEGGEVSATSNQVTVTVEGAQPTASASASPSSATLSIVVDADAYTLTEAGEVNFQITITNNSDVLLSDLTVSEDTLGEIGSVSSMGKDSKIFDKTAEVDQTTEYTFKVTATQEDGTPVTAVTDPLTITVEGSSGPGLGFLGVLLIIIVIAIVAVGVTLFLMHRKHKNGGGSGGGVFGGKSGGKGPYNGRRKPSAYNNSNGGGRQSKATRTPAAPPKANPPKGNTRFGDRNKF